MYRAIVAAAAWLPLATTRTWCSSSSASRAASTSEARTAAAKRSLASRMALMPSGPSSGTPVLAASSCITRTTEAASLTTRLTGRVTRV